MDLISEIHTAHGERELPSRDGTMTTIRAMLDAEGFTPGDVTEDSMSTISSKSMLGNFEAFNAAFEPLSSKKIPWPLSRRKACSATSRPSTRRSSRCRRRRFHGHYLVEKHARQLRGLQRGVRAAVVE